jgi:transposase-like protein
MSKLNALVPYASHRSWTIEEARTVLCAVAKSGLTIYSFAQRHGVDPQRLYYWRRRVEGDALAPAFVEVHRASAGPVEIVVRSGRVLRVADTIDGETLRKLVAALEDSESSC